MSKLLELDFTNSNLACEVDGVVYEVKNTVGSNVQLVAGAALPAVLQSGVSKTITDSENNVTGTIVAQSGPSGQGYLEGEAGDYKAASLNTTLPADFGALEELSTTLSGYYEGDEGIKVYAYNNGQTVESKQRYWYSGHYT